MKLRKIHIENVRSFLDPAELLIDGEISILIGPNGGGKTNLLDIAVTVLRRHLLISFSAKRAPTIDAPDRYQIIPNNNVNNLQLEPHTQGSGRKQIVELELEVTEQDIDNMKAMKSGAEELESFATKKYDGVSLRSAASWDINVLNSTQRLLYRWVNGSLEETTTEAARIFKEYLWLFEAYNRVRDDLNLAPLSTTMISLPVNRASGGFAFSVSLSGYNEFDHKNSLDAATSRSGGSALTLAIGKIATKFRLLLEKDSGSANSDFYKDQQILSLTKALRELGYDWKLKCISPMNNQYDISLSKQGSSFSISAASSGEKELLTYLFAIYALNVRDAIILIDEPELHLHPKWQQNLLKLFEKLSSETGNQFILATHSPIFVSPSSIRYVSRVYSHKQCSNIIRLKNDGLPDSRHLFNIINSHNNERMFFADKVILVEGISDRLFWEAFLKHIDIPKDVSIAYEIISVGGKGYFSRYQAILDACKVPYSIIADLDYVEQTGTEKIKSLFVLNAEEIKKDVFDNAKSLDGTVLMERIGDALKSGNFEDAKIVWEYIKSHRRQLKPTLNSQEQKLLNDHLAQKRSQKTFILSQGSLEAYLPAGHRGKDLDKLIRFLETPEFCWELSEAAQKELEEIATAILKPEVLPSASIPKARQPSNTNT